MSTLKTTGRTGKIPAWIWWVTALAAAIVLTLAVEAFPHGASQGGTQQSICNIDRQAGISLPAGC